MSLSEGRTGSHQTPLRQRERAPLARASRRPASLLLGPYSHEGRRRLRPEPNRHFPPWVAGRFAPSILIYLDDSVRVRPSVRPSVLFPPSHPPFFPSISPQPLRRCPRDRASHAIRGRKNDPTPTNGRTDGRTVGWTAGERNMERSPEVRSSGRDRERGGDGGGKAGLSDGHQ